MVEKVNIKMRIEFISLTHISSLSSCEDFPVSIWLTTVSTSLLFIFLLN